MYNFVKRIRYIGSLIKKLELQYTLNKYRYILSKNEKYANKYSSKRCFIIGNGPSIKDQDLTKLKGEYIFVVNNFVLHKDYEIIKPTFYVVGDGRFFDKKNDAIYKNILSIADKKHKSVIFFPIDKKHIIKNTGMEKNVEINYVLNEYEKQTITKCDITQYIPKAHNVLNQAVYIAVSMGFSEIYILGADMTAITNIIDYNDGVMDGGHFFDNHAGNEINEYYKSLISSRHNENMLALYAKAFTKFRLINDYARSRGIKIVNLTPRTALDVFEFSDLYKVINK